MGHFTKIVDRQLKTTTPTTVVTSELASMIMIPTKRRRRELPREQQQSQRRQPVQFLLLLLLAAWTLEATTVDAFSNASPLQKFHRTQTLLPQKKSNSVSCRLESAASDEIDADATAIAAFDAAVRNRYACTRYRRHDGIDDFPEGKTASPADPRVLALAKQALELATRAPTGFNVQPYKLLLVESVAAKQALSKYCIGRNRDRVLDSDCTVLFLADRQAMLSWKDYKQLLLDSNNERNRTKSKWAWLKLRALIALFSTGLPLPKILAGPISFGVRLAMRIVSWFARAWLVVPTLSSPECWSQKNTMLVAMSYMLGCSARGLETTPMEGYLSWGVRQSLKIPRRYTIPLMVSTGKAYHAKSSSSTSTEGEDDDAGMSHGTSPDQATPRFPIQTIMYENEFP